MPATPRKPRPKRNQVRVTVHVPPEVKDWLDNLARLNDRATAVEAGRILTQAYRAQLAKREKPE